MHACRQDTLNGAGITLADGNTIDFIRIQETPGDAIFGNGVNGATISNCEIANLTNNGSGIQDDRATGNWTISNNAMSGVDSIGIFLNGQTGDSLVAIIADNEITGSSGGAMSFSYLGSGMMRAQIVRNVMTGTTNPGATFEAQAFNTASICFDIEGNNNDDAYSISRDVASATIEVEELDILTTINTGSAIVTTLGGSLAPTRVDDGACGPF